MDPEFEPGLIDAKALHVLISLPIPWIYDFS